MQDKDTKKMQYTISKNTINKTTNSTSYVDDHIYSFLETV